MVIYELLLLGIGHVLQGVVFPLQVIGQRGQSCGRSQGGEYSLSFIELPPEGAANQADAALGVDSQQEEFHHNQYGIWGKSIWII